MDELLAGEPAPPPRSFRTRSCWPRDVQQIAGHRSLQTTQGYIDETRKPSVASLRCSNAQTALGVCYASGQYLNCKSEGSMREGLIALVAVLSWVVWRLWRNAWSLIRLIVIAAVIFGAFKNVFAHAPASWPKAEISIGGFSEYLTLAFMMAADGWLPLGFVLIVLWTFGIRNNVKEIKSDTTQTKIAMVALMNYLDLGVETEGMKELKGGFKGLAGLLMTSIGLKLLTGKFDDDALTAKPVRLNSGASVTLLSDISDRIQRTNSAVASLRS